MAEGLPTPKSREQILSEMLTEYVGLTGVNDLNTGSVLTQFFDVVARSVARTSGDIFQILRDYSIDRATGEALNRIGDEERVYRKVAQTATGTVKVTDTSFEKISTKVYAGSTPPNIGSKEIKVSDASLFPSTGNVYIGRGTPNIEGPLALDPLYPPVQVGSYWVITLLSPTTKFHNISESVILGQGGTRNISIGTPIMSPGSGAVADVLYTVSSAAILLDGENVNEYVQIVAQQPGSSSNAPAGAIREFSSSPFAGASVINTLPLTTGSDSELDDDYRDRIKKQRLSKGLGTALAVKNSVLNARASDENAIVTSNEIDTTNPEQTILYIDNGQGYEEKTQGIGTEFIVDSAVGGERSFQLATGGRQTSIAKAFLISSETTPFAIYPYDRLAILVGGLISEHIFNEGDFKSPGSATAYEIVASINNNTDLKFEATTAEGGSKILIQAKTEDNEFLQLSIPSSGTDASPVFGFPKNEVRTLLLYKNRELLDKNGRYAFVISKIQYDWNNSITDGDTLIISVDGTDEITYTFTNKDFLNEGQHSSVSSKNNLSAWANVINNKITGVTAEVNGEQIKLTSNLGSSNRASISINPASTLVSKGMFSSSLGLSAQGNEADFELSRNTAQIKLKYPLTKGDSLQLGTEYTRAEIVSNKILGGQTTIAGTGFVWLVVDGEEITPISTGVTGDTFISVSKPVGTNDIVRYTSTNETAFDNVEIGDYVIVWSEQLATSNQLEGRVHAFTGSTLDLRVTVEEASLAVEQGSIQFFEGFTVVRTKHIPQKIKIPSNSYNIGVIADIMNSQLTNATVKIDNEEIFVIRTNTENTTGSLFLVDFNTPAKTLNFIKNSSSSSISSQIAFYESTSSDKDFPSFVHGKITSDVNKNPPDSYINSIELNEDLSGLDPKDVRFVHFDQPYNSVSDVSSTEDVEIDNYLGTTLNLKNSYLYRRSRVNDRFHLLNGLDFGHEDSLVAILDNDPNQKTFNMPFYRTAVTNTGYLPNPDSFRAYDLEGGTATEFTEFFDSSFSFNNYKCLMQAKNIIDPGNFTGTTPSVGQDAILFRSTEWGSTGEKIGIGYSYPTLPNKSISHVINVDEEININIFLKSGIDRGIIVDGATKWDVLITPFDDYIDYVTYSHSGGPTPNLSLLQSGDYVSIIDFGEFNTANLGSFKIDSAEPNSFTIIRKKDEAVAESNITTLQTNTISFFQSSSTTAQEIVDYVNSNLSNFITASLVNDNGTEGSGIINLSTEDDFLTSGYFEKYIKLLDGKNTVLISNLYAPTGSPQFTFNTPLNLAEFSTFNLAYSFNNGEKIRLIPTTSDQAVNFLNVLAVTGFSTLGKIKSIERNSKIQLSTDTIGSEGSIEIAGGTANSATAIVEGSSSAIGQQGQQSCILSINSASAPGFHSDQWVKVSASNKQRKAILINSSNSIRLTESTPTINYSKIELLNRNTDQRLFGRNRHHTRTLNRTFKIEKQGQFSCISWDENGDDPYFFKEIVDIHDTSPSTLTFYKNDITNTVDISVDTGPMNFDEVAVGDVISIDFRPNNENNGTFTITGRSNDGKTLRILNPEGISELVSGSIDITDNSTVTGCVFTIGSSNLTAGVDFIVGATDQDTASNLAAAISVLPNLVVTTDASTVNVKSNIPGVTVALAKSGSGAVVSGPYLVAPISNTYDLKVKSTIQEGDSVSIGLINMTDEQKAIHHLTNDFDILNTGIFRVIRKFKNSFYIYNPNTVEEEVTLSKQYVNILPNFSISPKLIFTNGSTTVSSVGNVSWTASVSPGDFVKDASKNDSYYYKILSVDSLSQVTLTTVFNETSSSLTSGTSAVYTIANTVYHILKEDGFCRLVWTGAGLEPSLENARPGDVVVLGSDFDVSYQSEDGFHVVNSGTKLQEITKVKQSSGSEITSGQYFLFYSAEDANGFYVWFDKGGGVDPVYSHPSLASMLAIKVDILNADSTTQVATKVKDRINATFSSDFTAISEDGYVTITTVGYGETTNASNGNVGGSFSIEILQEGRRNFLDFVKSSGITQTYVTASNMIGVHREAMKFKEYEGAIPGDTVVITNNFLGASNKKNFVIYEVLNENEVIVNGVAVSTGIVPLGSNFNKVYLEEASPYIGYKKISLIVTNPSNYNAKNIVFDTSNQFEKIGEIGGVSLNAMSKLEFPTTINKGTDCYKYNTGLIAEANRIVYGDPRDNTTYPGVAAAGAEIFIKAPLVKRIQIAIDVRVKTGIPFTTIIEEIRNSAAALVNSNPVGKSIPISDIVTIAGGVIGVQAVAISSPQYDAQNDIIRVNAGEKSLILDAVSDITVSKIE